MPAPTVVSQVLQDDGRYLITLSDGATFYSPYAITASSGLPANAAQETGGHLASMDAEIGAHLSNVDTATAGLAAAVGAQTDAAAGTDTGTFSFVSLFKRALQTLTSIKTAVQSTLTVAGTVTANQGTAGGAPWPVSGTVSLKGSIAGPTTLQAAQAGNANGATFDTTGMDTLLLEVSGTYVGNVAFERLGPDGTTWFSLGMQLAGTGELESSTQSGETGLFKGDVTAVTAVRARTLNMVSGAVAVVAQASSGTEYSHLVTPTAATLGASTALQTAATALGNGVALSVAGMASWLATLTGTFVGTVTWEGSEDSTNGVNGTWNSLDDGQSGLIGVGPTATAPGLYAGSCAGLRYVRGRISSYTSGAITVTATASPTAWIPRQTNALLPQKLAGEDLTNDVLKIEGQFSNLNVSTATTTVVKSGAGYLDELIIAGGTLGNVTVYDNTAASGTILCPAVTPVAGARILKHCKFSTGLTIVTAAATVITGSYR